MIDEKKVDEALHFLIASAKEIGALVEEARTAENFVKHVEALEMKKRNEESVAAQQREARASENYKNAIDRDARATAALRELIARREAAEITISVWQSQIKAQQGPRP